MENKAMIEIFAENLGFARRARGYSQAFMAERLGIARSTYAGYGNDCEAFEGVVRFGG